MSGYCRHENPYTSRCADCDEERETARENAALLAENERLRAALSGTLTALRLARDSEPERWDALMGSRIGPEVATAWDKLNAALAGEE